MKLSISLAFLVLLVTICMISCRKEKKSYTNSDTTEDSTAIIFEKIAGYRTLKFLRIVNGHKGDTSYSLPNETFTIQYVNTEIIHLPHIKNCYSPEADLKFQPSLSKNSIRVYTYYKDFTKIALYYDYVADTVYIEDMFTQKDPNSMGGNTTYYYTIGSSR